MMTGRRLGPLLMLLSVLVACEGFNRSSESVPSGTRVSVLSLDKVLQPDEKLASLEVRLPRPYANADWPQDGGSPTNAMHHLALEELPMLAWSADIGARTTKERYVTARPVVANQIVFVMDAKSSVEARNIVNGSGLWRVNLVPRGERAGVIGGGLAVVGGRVYVSTGYGEVIALDATSGQLVWRVKLGVPLRGAPTVLNGRLFVIGVDNRTFALDVATGKQIWLHSGVVESASILGAGSIAASANLVVTPYSSGEIFALNAIDGQVMWADNLVRNRPRLTLADINDVNSRPVIYKGVVYTVGSGGRMVADDLITGARIWVQDVGSYGSPWIAGDYLYLISREYALVAISRTNGLVRWVTPLPRYVKQKKGSKKIVWVGPLLASDRLVVLSSRGEMVAYSPYTGQKLGSVKLSSGTFIEPVLADRTLLILTNDGLLSAYR